jgi:hypothetical protein
MYQKWKHNYYTLHTQIDSKILKIRKVENNKGNVDKIGIEYT